MKNKKLILLSIIMISIFTIKNTYASTNLVGLNAVKNYDVGNVYRLTQPLNETSANVDKYWFFQNKHKITEDYLIFTSNIVRSNRSKLWTYGSVGGFDQGEPYNAVYQDWYPFFNETNISIWLLYEDQQVSQCSIDFDDGLIVCPIRTHTSPISSMKIWFRTSSPLSDVDLTMNLVIQSISVSYNNLNSAIVNEQKETNNKLNEDISTEDKEAPNTTNYENSKQQEENIRNSISNANPNDITFNTDLTATSKIWEIVTNFLNTNSKVMGLMISILSLGVIKMILNR